MKKAASWDVQIQGERPDEKYERFHEKKRLSKKTDFRNQGQLDYDRIVHTSAFMRLGGISQVAHAEDSTVVHNRLTHSLKVASIGFGLAQRLKNLHSNIVGKIGGVDPYIVAAAGLAHDLGHPPFGHVAERVLHAHVNKVTGERDGFEGNAQSFRVVTKTSIRSRKYTGLDLSRATLCAMLKYPRMCEVSDGKPVKKWGAYETEKTEFEFARLGTIPQQRSPEAEIMDFADDIAYSTHDFEDYYRAGLIPLDRLLTSRGEQQRFLDYVINKQEIQKKRETAKCFEEILKSWDGFTPLNEPYQGLRAQRGAARTLASQAVRKFMDGIVLTAPTKRHNSFVKVDEEVRLDIWILKQLIWYYVIPQHEIAEAEYGQQKIIEFLFETFWKCAEPENKRNLLPAKHVEQLDIIKKQSWSNPSEPAQHRCRIIVDYISEMTEHQAVQCYLRLHGHPSRSPLDLVRR